MNESSKPAGQRPKLSLPTNAPRAAAKEGPSRAQPSRGGRKRPTPAAGDRFQRGVGSSEQPRRSRDGAPSDAGWQSRDSRPARPPRDGAGAGDRFQRGAGASEQPRRPRDGGSSDAGWQNRDGRSAHPPRGGTGAGDRFQRSAGASEQPRRSRDGAPSDAGWQSRDSRPARPPRDGAGAGERFQRSAGASEQPRRPRDGGSSDAGWQNRDSRLARPPRGGAGAGDRFQRNAGAPVRPTRVSDTSQTRSGDGQNRPSKPQQSFGKTQGRFAPKPNANVYRAEEAAHKKPLPTSIEKRVQVTHFDEAIDGIRLNKRMAELGLCSRREADEWIEKGWVLVNGQTAIVGQRVQVQDAVELDRKADANKAQQVTIVLHKPIGYVSGQAEDGHEPAVVLITEQNHWPQDDAPQRFSPSQLRGLAPAGRLDIDSTGLLVLTQNGIVARQIIGEQSDVDKEYLVRVEYATPEGNVVENVQSVFPVEKLDLLRQGLSLDGKALLPAKVDWQNPEQLRFVLREGKKRQIRRMCELVGLRVVGLKRIRIGGVVLGNLPKGQWRYLGENERFV